MPESPPILVPYILPPQTFDVGTTTHHAGNTTAPRRELPLSSPVSTTLASLAPHRSSHRTHHSSVVGPINKFSLLKLSNTDVDQRDDAHDDGTQFDGADDGTFTSHASSHYDVGNWFF
ncbi:Uncharacterized protein Fot_40559 [Forsythia ovata]|uniref:Uncharacterized protein n=1 Tax=Forsythia ovata TaxID=205694 RepID=A0ABD1S7V6_9LAMI